MELKLEVAEYCRFPRSLLIVPYGIETRTEGKGMEQGYRLLIVPYGIETTLTYLYIIT